MKVLITGAAGFIGGAIAERLIARAEIRSLTSHPSRNRFGGRVRTFPYDFERPAGMADAFRGVVSWPMERKYVGCFVSGAIEIVRCSCLESFARRSMTSWKVGIS